MLKYKQLPCVFILQYHFHSKIHFECLKWYDLLLYLTPQSVYLVQFHTDSFLGCFWFWSFSGHYVLFPCQIFLLYYVYSYLGSSIISISPFWFQYVFFITLLSWFLFLFWSHQLYLFSHADFEFLALLIFSFLSHQFRELSWLFSSVFPIVVTCCFLCWTTNYKVLIGRFNPPTASKYQ